VLDSTAGAYRLYVSGANLTATARIVFVLEHALSDVRDDLHVPMRMHQKAAARGDFIVIPDHETAELRVGWVALVGDSEVVLGLEPAVISTSKRVPGSKLQHFHLPV
jgi:hypothetical protein